MSREVEITKNPYDSGFDLFKKDFITLNQGVTILVGCNGIGKSTLLRSLAHTLEVNDTPYIEFDNLKDGGANARNNSLFYDDIGFLATAMTSSEGENIMLNISNFSKIIGRFCNQNRSAKELWILLDACDSGLSIDNVLELKELFTLVINDNLNSNVYFIVAANEYEMANGEQCFDVYNGEYVQLNSYEDYREMILRSRKEKKNRESNV